MTNLLLVNKLQHCLLVMNQGLPYIFLKYQFANETILLSASKMWHNKKLTVTAHQLFMFFKSHLLCSLELLLYYPKHTHTKKGKNQAVALLNVSAKLSLKSGWNSLVQILLNNAENSHLLDYVLGLLQITFYIYFLSVWYSDFLKKKKITSLIYSVFWNYQTS